MPLDAGFLDMLQTTVTWVHCTGEDEWGNETYDPPQPVQCFITEQRNVYGDMGRAGRRDLLVNKQDHQSVYDVSLITDAIGVGLKDQFVLPGGQTVYVMSVETPKDEHGVDIFHNIDTTTTQKG